MERISIFEYNHKNLINIYKNWCYICIIDKYIKNNIHDEFNDKIYNECLKFKELCKNNNNKNHPAIHLLFEIDDVCSSQEKIQLWQYCNTLTYDNQLSNRLINLFDLCEKIFNINHKQFNQYTYIIHNNNNIYAIFDLYIEHSYMKYLIFNPNINIDINLFFDIIQKYIVSSHFVIYLSNSYYNLNENSNKYYIKQLSINNSYIICSMCKNIKNKYLANIKIQRSGNITEHTTYVDLKNIKSKFDECIIYKYIFKEPIIKIFNEYEYIDLITIYNNKQYSCIDNYYSNITNGINKLNKIKYTINIPNYEHYEIIYGLYLVNDMTKCDVISSIISFNEITRNSFVNYMNKICDPISWIDIPLYNKNVTNNINITRDMIISILKYCNKNTILKLRLINRKFRDIISETYEFTVKIEHNDINKALEMRKPFQNIYFSISSTEHFTDDDLKSLQHIKYLELDKGDITHEGISSIGDNLENLNFNMIYEMFINNLKFIPTLTMLKILDLTCYMNANSTCISDFITDETSPLMINLEELYLPYGIDENTNLHIQHLCNMRSLKVIRLGSYNLVGIPNKSLNLICITIEDIISSSNVLNILKFCPLLEELYLPCIYYRESYTKNFKEIISYIPKLKCLYYDEMDLSVEDFNKMKNLEFLQTNNISDYNCLRNLIGLSLTKMSDNIEHIINNINFPKFEYFKCYKYYSLYVINF